MKHFVSGTGVRQLITSVMGVLTNKESSGQYSEFEENDVKTIWDNRVISDDQWSQITKRASQQLGVALMEFGEDITDEYYDMQGDLYESLKNNPDSITAMLSERMNEVLISISEQLKQEFGYDINVAEYIKDGQLITRYTPMNIIEDGEIYSAYTVSYQDAINSRSSSFGKTLYAPLSDCYAEKLFKQIMDRIRDELPKVGVPIGSSGEDAAAKVAQQMNVMADGFLATTDLTEYGFPGENFNTLTSKYDVYSHTIKATFDPSQELNIVTDGNGTSSITAKYIFTFNRVDDSGDYDMTGTSVIKATINLY